MEQKDIEKLASEYVIKMGHPALRTPVIFGRDSIINSFIAGANAMQPEMERLKKENQRLRIENERLIEENKIADP